MNSVSMPVKPLLIYRIFSAVILCCGLTSVAMAQVNSTDHLLQINFTDKDSTFNAQTLKLQTRFPTALATEEYIVKLPSILAGKGYPLASVDSFWTTEQTTHIILYIGNRFDLIQLTTVNIDKKALDESGYYEKNILNKPLNIAQMQQLQQRLLNHFERNGYPFASVYLDSIRLENDKMYASLKADKSVLYHIDSIRVIGNAKISKRFLQHYLGMSNGSLYNKDKLALTDKKILDLNYVTQVQPSDITMLGSGSVVNLYLQQRRSSQVNFLIGFLPASNATGKLQLTGDVNLDLKNMFGTGESILLKWQQLQVKSPRLNIGYNQPYIFNSPFGFDLLFDLFKKDSSFLQINAQVGAEYSLNARQTGKLFVQFQNTSLLSGGVDTNLVKSQKKLPPNIDVKSVNVGISYDLQNTDYKFNPRTGNEISVTASVGIKNISRNNEIISLKDPGFNYASLYDSLKAETHQLRLKFSAAHFFPLGKFTTLKAQLSSGIFTSPLIFRNELFQIGGYKLLRGFDEESIYASRYMVATAEYRILIDRNSYLFIFTDAGFTKNKYQSVNVNNNFIGAGLGILYETRLGLLNLSYGIGKRDDIKFNLRESSKLHFGYINYF